MDLNKIRKHLTVNEIVYVLGYIIHREPADVSEEACLAECSGLNNLVDFIDSRYKLVASEKARVLKHTNATSIHRFIGSHRMGVAQSGDLVPRDGSASEILLSKPLFTIYKLVTVKDPLLETAMHQILNKHHLDRINQGKIRYNSVEEYFILGYYLHRNPLDFNEITFLLNRASQGLENVAQFSEITNSGILKLKDSTQALVRSLIPKVHKYNLNFFTVDHRSSFEDIFLTEFTLKITKL